MTAISRYLWRCFNAQRSCSLLWAPMCFLLIFVLRWLKQLGDSITSISYFFIIFTNQKHVISTTQIQTPAWRLHLPQVMKEHQGHVSVVPALILKQNDSSRNAQWLVKNENHSTFTITNSLILIGKRKSNLEMERYR